MKNKRVRAALRVTLIILIVICLAFLLLPAAALGVFLSRHVDYHGVETSDYPLQGIFTADEFGLSERRVTLETADGISISCADIAPENPRAVVILLTGIVQPSVTYFYPHAALLSEHGYASILTEVRSHGESEGNTIGLGYTEVEDVRAVCSYIRSRAEYKELPLIIYGVSMGGAVALNSFGQLEDIDACIACSAYSSFENELDLLLGEYGVPSLVRSALKPGIGLGLRLLYGSEAVDTLRPIKQIQNAGGRPVLLIACTGDDSVPYENSLALHKAYPKSELWLRDSWEHFIVKDCNFREVRADREYCETLLAFLDAV